LSLSCWGSSSSTFWVIDATPVEAAQVGGALAIGETLTKIGLFYIHDRVWERLPFGRADTENIPTAPDETDY
jgi:hypothetical protein